MVIFADTAAHGTAAREPDVAHELRTALTAARGQVELLGRRLAALDGYGELPRRNQRAALAQLDRMEGTIRQHLDGGADPAASSPAERRRMLAAMVRDLSARVAALSADTVPDDPAEYRERTAQIRRITATIEECNILIAEQ